jgi:riboflavin kinase/FMN adenylyltransferase
MTLAVGFFDGVHLGHQAILRGADAALTFREHPLSVLRPEMAPALLMSFDARVAAIGASGVGRVVALAFTRELAELSPDAFAARLRAMGADEVRCGANWRFGKGGAGDADFLGRHGFRVTVVPYAEFDGAPVSSTRVRAALASGRMDEAAAMLGRPWSASGEVFRGKGVGREIGFPTVNLRLGPGIVQPPRGVYAVEARGARGVANLGVAPTMGARAWEASVLEVHFTDSEPAYADEGPMEVRFLRFLRPERAFASVGELKAQIERDIRAAAEC